MGMIDSTTSIGQQLETLNAINNEKETQREIVARLERKLEMYFTEKFELYGTTYIYQFYNIYYRNEIIKELGTNDFEYVRLNKLYDKTLNRVHKMFKLHAKYEDWNCNDLDKTSLKKEN